MLNWLLTLSLRCALLVTILLLLALAIINIATLLW